MRKTYILFFILFVIVGTQASAENVRVTFHSNPPGATIKAEGKVWGKAPVTLKYPLKFKQLIDNHLEVSPVTARWKSGATQTSNIIIKPKAGKKQSYTFQRPDAPDLDIDLKYAEVLKKQIKEQKRLERIKNDPHSLEAIVHTLKSPIPENMIALARQADDDLMRSGQGSGSKLYLVTDHRADRVNRIIVGILKAMGEPRNNWVVRVFDTSPKVENAFVTGGKYIYVFTGLIDNAASDDELAFVLSHEIGHSSLKHYLRKKSDTTTSLITGIASIVGALSKKHRAGAAAVSKYFTSSYSRIDEEEADAFASAAARRAGFNPIRGANFFVRMQRQVDEELQQAQTEYNQAKALCADWQRIWNSRPDIRTQENADRHNAACNDAQAKQSRFSQLQNSIKSQSVMSSHPSNQNRIAAIAALSDYLEGRRGIDSLQSFQQSYRVMMALNEVGSILLRASDNSTKHQQIHSSVPVSPKSIEERLKELQTLRNNRLITESEFQQKRHDIINSL